MTRQKPPFLCESGGYLSSGVVGVSHRFCLVEVVTFSCDWIPSIHLTPRYQIHLLCAIQLVPVRGHLILKISIFTLSKLSVSFDSTLPNSPLVCNSTGTSERALDSESINFHPVQAFWQFPTWLCWISQISLDAKEWIRSSQF